MSHFYCRTFEGVFFEVSTLVPAMTPMQRREYGQRRVERWATLWVRGRLTPYVRMLIKSRYSERPTTATAWESRTRTITTV
jgi:hypothetical protein